MLARRTVLAAPLVLAACGGGAPSQTLTTVVQDVQTIAMGLSKTLTQLSMLNLPGLTPAILDICQTALAGIQTVGQALLGVSSTTDAQPLVQRVEGYVNAFVGALAFLPLPGPIQLALVAATILLPIIESAVNLVVTAKTVMPVTVSSGAASITVLTPAPSAAAPVMTPAQARATLTQ